MAKSKIHIKESKKGTFTKAAKARGKSVAEFEKQVLSHKENYSPAMVKKANFSRNAKKWKKGENGLTLEGDPILLPGTLENAIDPLNPNNAYSPFNSQYAFASQKYDGITPPFAPQRMQIEPIQFATPTPPSSGFKINPQDPRMPKSFNNLRGPQKKKKEDPTPYIIGGLELISSLIPEQSNQKKYLRPEDQLSYNAHPYGTNSQAIMDMGGSIPGFTGNFYGRSTQKLKKGGKMCYGDGGELSLTKPIPSPNFKGKKVQIMSLEHGGQLKTYTGGSAPQISENPFDGGTGLFQGKSHDEGGIKATFSGKPFEAEGGEPYRLAPNGDLEIFGNLKNPVTGNSFKTDGKKIAKQEQKTQKFIDMGLELVNNSPEKKGKFELLKFNSGQAMLRGGLGKQKELAKNKEQLSLLQKMMLQEESPEKAKYGAIYEDGKPWEYRGTNTKSLDEKIKGFVKLVEEKGLEGYSGVKSGYDKRNTKSGRPSRHASNQALDMIFKDKDAYQKILNDPELSSYLYNNGLTAINEYDPNVASKTGATAGHLHIGYDKGTKTSDQFRNDYKSLYSPKGKAPSVASPLSRPIQGAFSGDAQTEIKNQWTPGLYNFNGTKKPTSTTTTQTTPQPFNFKNPPVQNTPPIPTRFPWEQVLPLAPQLFDTPDAVQAQLYNPELEQPYQISLQDQRNRNTTQLRALSRQAAYSPQAISTIGGQAFSANNDIDANEFRINQENSAGVYNRNRATLNDAQLKNLSILDTQYTRQAQAKANTEDRRADALIQLGDLVAKNNLENKTLNVYHNLYKDYTYDETGNLQYVGPTAAERLGEYPTPLPATMNTKTVTTDRTSPFKTVQSTYEPITDFRSQIKKSLRKSFKKGGSISQNKLSKLMNS